MEHEKFLNHNFLIAKKTSIAHARIFFYIDVCFEASRRPFCPDFINAAPAILLLCDAGVVSKSDITKCISACS